MQIALSLFKHIIRENNLFTLGFHQQFSDRNDTIAKKDWVSTVLDQSFVLAIF